MILKGIKGIAAAAIVGLLAGLAAPHAAEARSSRKSKDAHEETALRDCTPFNGPSNYYGNPWCDNGWKYAEDYAPGTSPHYDLFDLPQLRRLDRWRY